MNSLINIGIIVTYILAAIAIGSWIFFALKALVVDFKGATASLAGIGIIVVLFIVSFLISGKNDVSVSFFEKTETNFALSKLIGSGLIMLYFMIAAVVIVVIYSQFIKLFKR
jgi:hypothetical protein